MRPRTPALILCSLLVALAGCSSGDADAAASGSATSSAVQVRKGPPLFDLSRSKCQPGEIPGSYDQARATVEIAFDSSTGEVTVDHDPLHVERGHSIVWKSNRPFALAIPSAVDLANPGQHHVSSGAGKVEVSIEGKGPPAALCGEFKYSVAVYANGGVHVIDPTGIIWP